jgi:hypothetical protein
LGYRTHEKLEEMLAWNDILSDTATDHSSETGSLWHEMLLRPEHSAQYSSQPTLAQRETIFFKHVCLYVLYV